MFYPDDIKQKKNYIKEFNLSYLRNHSVNRNFTILQSRGVSQPARIGTGGYAPTLLMRMAKTRLHVVVEGIVQGVFFRARTREEASSLGLSGWVRNCLDGRVEAVFEGEKDKVEKILKWCKKGPQGATVRNVEENWEEATGEFDSFSIKYLE